MSDDAPETPGGHAPWRPLPDETARAHEVFRVYLELGRERTLGAAATAAGHAGPRTVEAWSARYHWLARARAWDEYQDSRADAVAVEERELLMREMVRDRVRIQRDYHRFVHAVPGVLHGIATDVNAPPSARVAACRIIVEQAGYAPDTPPLHDASIADLALADILRLGQILDRVRPGDGARLIALVQDAAELRDHLDRDGEDDDAAD